MSGADVDGDSGSAWDLPSCRIPEEEDIKIDSILQIVLDKNKLNLTTQYFPNFRNKIKINLIHLIQPASI